MTQLLDNILDVEQEINIRRSKSKEDVDERERWL